MIAKGMRVKHEGDYYTVVRVHGDQAYVRQWNRSLRIYEQNGRWMPVKDLEASGWTSRHVGWP